MIQYNHTQTYAGELIIIFYWSEDIYKKLKAKEILFTQKIMITLEDLLKVF